MQISLCVIEKTDKDVNVGHLRILTRGRYLFCMTMFMRVVGHGCRRIMNCVIFMADVVQCIKLYSMSYASHTRMG